MGDWPQDLIDNSPFGVFSTAGEGSPAGEAVLNSGSQLTGTTLWVANLAIFVPIVVRLPITVFKLAWQPQGGTGNVDLGIYDKMGVRRVSSGSTAQSGTTALVVDITDTTLEPGLYYLAMACDSALNIGAGSPGAPPMARMAGCAQQSSAFPLPSTATFAACTYQNVPLIWGSVEQAVL